MSSSPAKTNWRCQLLVHHCGADTEIAIVVVGMIVVPVHLSVIHVTNLHVAVCPFPTTHSWPIWIIYIKIQHADDNDRLWHYYFRSIYTSCASGFQWCFKVLIYCRRQFGSRLMSCQTTALLAKKILGAAVRQLANR